MVKKRWHAGTTQGFVNSASLVFASKSNTGDYHGDMNSTLFKRWIEEKVIPNLQNPSYIVMDNAPYHSVVLNKASCSKKLEISEWLRHNNIEHSLTMSKYELLSLVKINHREKVYKNSLTTYFNTSNSVVFYCVNDIVNVNV